MYVSMDWLSGLPTRRSSTGSCSAMMQSLGLLPQFSDQLVCLVRRQIHAVLVIHQDARGAFAAAEALRELHGDLAVGAGAARLHVQLFANVLQQFLAAAERTRQAAADPQACFAE